MTSQPQHVAELHPATDFHQHSLPALRPKTWRGIELPRGVFVVDGETLAGERGTQALTFNANLWTADKALAWLETHAKQTGPVDFQPAPIPAADDELEADAAEST